MYAALSGKISPVRLSVMVLFSTVQFELPPLKEMPDRLRVIVLWSIRMPLPPVTVATPTLFSPTPVLRVMVNPDRRVLSAPRRKVSFAPPNWPTMVVVAAPAPSTETPAMLRSTSSWYVPESTWTVPPGSTRAIPSWMAWVESAGAGGMPTPSQ